MTTHEKTRLIELLCSGDESNILLAKEICEQQNCIYLSKIAYRGLRKQKKKEFKRVRKMKGNEPFKKYNNLYHVYCVFVSVYFGVYYDQAVYFEASKKDYDLMGSYFGVNWQDIENTRLKIQSYYAQHLQSSE